ncbi:hypothetical protein HN873_063964 [Arachis hypogaea]
MEFHLENWTNSSSRIGNPVNRFRHSRTTQRSRPQPVPPPPNGVMSLATAMRSRRLGGPCVAQLIAFCPVLLGGEINRVKHHLAGKGGDIETCRKMPTVVRHQFNQNIENLRTKKRKTQEEYAESYNTYDEVEREFDEIERNEM